MNSTSNVSVCMAVYNGEEYIRQQIESVLNELRVGDELLICDDFSTDDTVKIIGEFEADKRVRLIKNSLKLGVVKNFEHALQQAQCEYVFLCDQDDVWLPGKVEVCVNELSEHMLVVTDCIVVNQDLEVIHPSFFSLQNSGAGILRNIWSNSYLGCCMAFRRELLNLSLPIPVNMPMHDMWLGLVAQANGSVLFIDKKMSLYRRHHSTVSAAAGVSNFGVFKKVQIRLKLMWYLSYRVLQIKLGGFSER